MRLEPLVAAVGAAVLSLCLSLPAPAAATAPGSDRTGLVACDSLLAAGRFAEGAACAQALLEAADARGEASSPVAAAIVESLLRARLGTGGRLDPSCPALASRLIGLREAPAEPQPLALAKALYLSGQVEERSGRFPAARTAYERAVAVREAAALPDDLDLVNCLTCLANIRARLDDYDGLDALYDRALAISERLEGPGTASAARILGNQAIYRKLVGDYPGARALYERSLALKVDLYGEDHPDVARTTYNLGNLLVEIGDYEAARAAYRRSLAIGERTAGPGSPEVARTLVGMAVLEKRAANLLAARDLAERAVAILRAGLPDHPRTAEALLTLAAIQSDLGDMASARGVMEEVLPVIERAYGPEHLRVGEAVGELGMLQQLSGEPLAALASFRRAQLIYEAIDPDNDRVAGILNTEAALLASLGRGREGRRLAQRAVAIRRAALAPGSPMVGWPLATLGSCLWVEGQDARADSALGAARTILESGWGSDHPACLAALFDLARVRRSRGRAADALDLALQVAAGRREALRLTMSGLPERMALAHADRWPAGLDLAVAIAAESGARPADLARLWSELIRSRALVLDEMALRHRRVAAPPGSAADSLQQQLAAVTRDLAGLLVEGWEGGGDEDFHGRSLALRAERERIERRLGRLGSRSAVSPGADTPGLATIAAALPPGAALVAYVRFDRLPRPVATDTLGPPPAGAPAYAAFVLPAGGREPVLLDLGPAAGIERLVETWRDEAGLGREVPGRPAAMAEVACRRAGTALRERIWDPLAPHLRSARRVYLVTDGPLDLVSFAALPAGEDRYLIDDARVLAYLGTERDLLQAPPVRVAAGGLLALGAPEFATTRAPLAFTPLPASADEVEAITALWQRARPARAGQGEVRTLLGREASEAAFKRLAPRYRALHLATHGFFLGGAGSAAGDGERGVGGLHPDGTTTAGGVGGGSGATGGAAVAPLMNPMLRAGLVLSGSGTDPAADPEADPEAGPEADDGILTAAEIATLDLRGVDWVVLSACDSGVGLAQAGEGVFGLRRAFRIAGARDLVISLWPLSDRLMRDWMVRLYGAHLSRGLDLVAAAWQAGREVLAQRRAAGLDTHPQTWAGFIACGE